MRHFPSLKHLEKSDILKEENKYFYHRKGNFITFKLPSSFELKSLFLNNIQEFKHKDRSLKSIQIQV